MGAEKELLHKPFAQFLKKLKLKYIYKNWQNHKRQGDEGFSDFIVFLTKGQDIHIEFKTPEKIKTKNLGLRPKQIEWKDYLKANDHDYYVLSDLGIAKTIILEAMNERNN